MKQETSNTNPAAGFRLRAYSPKQLSEMYEVSAKTLKRWLLPIKDEVGKRQGRYFNIAQVRCIIKHLGIPGNTTTE